MPEPPDGGSPMRLIISGLFSHISGLNITQIGAGNNARFFPLREVDGLIAKAALNSKNLP